MRFSSKLLIIGFVLFWIIFAGIKAGKSVEKLSKQNEQRINKAFDILKEK